MTAEELGRLVRATLTAQVGQALAPVIGAVKAFGERLDAMPVPKDGDKGEPGEPGPAGKDAAPIDMDAVKVMLDELVQRAVGALPKPQDGKDADPEVIKQLVTDAVGALPKPKDGEKGEKGDRGEPGPKARDGIDGDPGEPGKDAADITVLAAIDEAKIYPKGTFAYYRGGMITAVRKTSPITESLDASGWRVVMNGIAEESEQEFDEGRVIKRITTYTSGNTFEREYVTKSIIWRDTWKEGVEYEPGDVVTWGGSCWHCQQPPTGKPGDPNSVGWKMMVKKGAAGRDYSDPLNKTREPVRLK